MTDDIATDADVNDALAKLAAHGSPRDIAEHLRQEQCAGWRNNGAACPVSLYVHKVAGIRVHVAPLYWHRLVEMVTGGNPPQHPLPEAVAEFVALFDRSAFPDLLARYARGGPGVA